MQTNKAILLFSLSFFPFFLFAQNDKKENNNKFGVEIGIGYNTLKEVNKRKNIWIQPSQKLFYSLQVLNFSNNSKFIIPVFIGYYTFGGSSGIFSAIPEDSITGINTSFQSIESGFNPCWEKNNFQIGLLFKGQYILSAKDKTYYHGFTETTIERNVSNSFKKFAMNTGMKLKYRINKFSIAAEAWFGITNLNHNYYSRNINITENNYRILLGYEF